MDYWNAQKLSDITAVEAVVVLVFWNATSMRPAAVEDAATTDIDAVGVLVAITNTRADVPLKVIPPAGVQTR